MTENEKVLWTNLIKYNGKNVIFVISPKFPAKFFCKRKLLLVERSRKRVTVFILLMNIHLLCDWNYEKSVETFRSSLEDVSKHDYMFYHIVCLLLCLTILVMYTIFNLNCMFVGINLMWYHSGFMLPCYQQPCLS